MRKQTRTPLVDLTDREIRKVVRRIHKMNSVDDLLLRLLNEHPEQGENGIRSPSVPRRSRNRPT